MGTHLVKIYIEVPSTSTFRNSAVPIAIKKCCENIKRIVLEGRSYYQCQMQQ